MLNMLKYEHTCYMNPAIRSSRYIRPMYESINGSSDAEKDDPFCLAFEWMDCTLKEVPSAAHKRNSVLHKRTAEAVLGGFAELHSQHLVHSGRYRTGATYMI